MVSDAGAAVRRRGEVGWYVDQRLIIGEGGGRSDAMMRGSTSTLGTPISNNCFRPPSTCQSLLVLVQRQFSMQVRSYMNISVVGWWGEGARTWRVSLICFVLEKFQWLYRVESCFTFFNSPSLHLSHKHHIFFSTSHISLSVADYTRSFPLTKTLHHAVQNLPVRLQRAVRNQFVQASQAGRHSARAQSRNGSIDTYARAKRVRGCLCARRLER